MSEPPGTPEPPPGQVPYGQPYGAYPMPGYGPPMRDPDARPGTVLGAAIVTLASTGLVLLVLVVVLIAMLATRASFMEGFGDAAGMRSEGADSWFVAIMVVVLVLVAWCVAAALLAVLVLRRRNWARICLVVSSALSAVLSLLAITGGISVVPLAASIATIVCLFTGGAGDWFHHEHLYSPPKLPKV